MILIPPYGGLGAAIASSLAYTAGGLAIVIIFSRALASPVADLLPRRGEVSLYWRTVSTRLRRPRSVEEAAKTEPLDGGELG